jgi:flagellar FliL protein
MTVNLMFKRWVFVLSLLLAGGQMAWAQEDEAEGEDGAPAKVRPIYIPLKPPFVVNYGGKGKLKYLKAELSVRVASNREASYVRHHMPMIRNNIVLLFSRQHDEDIDTQEGKELLRQSALEEIRLVVSAEEGDETRDGIMDLYFNNFVIQK